MGSFAKFLHSLRLQRRHRGDVAGGGPVAAVDFRVPEMVCEGCAEKIDEALIAIPGVREIQPNVPQKRIRIRYEPTKVAPEQLKDAVSRAGFSAVDAEQP